MSKDPVGPNTCPDCGGKGYFISGIDPRGNVPCPACKGSGVVEWNPHGVEPGYCKLMQAIEALISQREREARIDELQGVVEAASHLDDTAAINNAQDRINELKGQSNDIR